MPTYTNSHAAFDVAINGVPFYLWPTNQSPLVRQPAQSRRDQIDQTSEPGEQSLTGWWYRSQSSFHLGAGLRFYDPIRGDQSSQYRFADSAGVNPWTKGEVSLLRRATLKDPQASWGDMVSWAHDGDSGLLYEDGDDIRCYKVSTDGSFVVDYEDGAEGTSNVWSVAAAGAEYWVLSNNGIYKGPLPGGNGSKVFTIPGADDNGVIRWAKDRLYAGVNNRLYELTDLSTPSKALPDGYDADTGRLMYTHPETDWKWSAIAPGPDAVFFSGYAGTSTTIHGNRSMVYATTLETSNVDAAPQSTPPTVAAEMPAGEFILNMTSYLGVYLILCTTKGVRVCEIGRGGQLRVGPLSIEAPAYSYSACVWDRFAYVAGAVTDGYDGVWRLDLSAPVDDSGLRFAYAKDVATTHLSASEGYVARVAMVGTTGRVAMMVKNSGVWMEHATELVASGWLRTGLIRFDTWEDKLFHRLRTTMDAATTGTVAPAWMPDESTANGLGSTTPVSAYDTAGSDGTPRMQCGYRFTLTRATTTTGPTLTGYQVRSMPANVKQREIRLPLLCARRERVRGGPTVERSVWDRVSALEALEKSGVAVPYQDFGTGEAKTVIVDQVQFVTEAVPQSRPAQSDPLGWLNVTLRVVD
jgi:hypothetical protein